MYKDLDEARFYCILNAKCTGISSLANEHFLASGIEMVEGLTIDIFRLKTSKELLHTFRTMQIADEFKQMLNLIEVTAMGFMYY